MLRFAPPPESRWLRTLPWLGGLLMGTAAHLMWWTSSHTGSTQATAPIEIHVHPPAPRPTVVTHAASGSSCRGTVSAAPASPTPAVDARGAVVCSDQGCSIRRSFVTRMLEQPSLLGRSTRLVPVHHRGRLTGLRASGVFPGSLADLLGLVSGDTIVAIDGRPLGSLPSVDERLAELPRADRVSLTLRHGDRVRTMHYAIVDG